MGVTGNLAAIEGSPTARQVALRTPGYWRCGIALGAAWLALRIAGFARTLRAVHALAARQSIAPVDAAEVRRVAHRVAVAAAFFPGRALCLEQSLTLYWLLRRRGVAARLRVGVHPAPFMAHAWVEYEGVPIDEDDDRIHELLPLPLDSEVAV